MNRYLILCAQLNYYLVAAYLLFCVPVAMVGQVSLANIKFRFLKTGAAVFVILLIAIVSLSGGGFIYAAGPIFFMIVSLFFVKNFERFVSEKSMEYTSLIRKKQKDISSQKESSRELDKILNEKRKLLDKIVANFTAARQTLVCIDVNELSDNIVKTIMNYPLVSSVAIFDSGGRCLAYSSKEAEWSSLKFKEMCFSPSGNTGGFENLLIYYFKKQSAPSDPMHREDIIGVCVVEFKKGYLTDKRGISDIKMFLSENVLSVFSLGFSRAVLFKEYEIKSRYDALTGIFNRRYFMEKLSIEINRARRYGGGFGVIMLDIDHFKKVNDTYGHTAGDTALVSVSRILADKISPRYAGMFCGRYGGEEFIGCIPIVHGRDEYVDSKILFEIPEVIRDEIRRNVISVTDVNNNETKQFSITVSIGVSEYPEDGESAEDVIAAADKALYLAKAAGRNRVVFYSEKNK